MPPPQELILSASAEASSSSSSSSASINRPNASASSVQLHDLLTSVPVQSLKPSNSAVHALGYVRSVNGVGGGVFVLQEGKAIVNVWTWQKDQIHVKLHLPEKLSCFSVSPNGCWAAGGSPSGHLYLWEISSGLLHASFTIHYRTITTLTFTPDSRLLLSGSLDASVHIYLISQLVDSSLPLPKPYGSLTDHTLPITSITVSPTSSVSGGRVWTTSEDGTVKVWDLHPPFDLLCTFGLPPRCTPVDVAVDPMERMFYVAGSSSAAAASEVEGGSASDGGSTRGEVWRVPMFKWKESLARATSGAMEAVGGGGIGSPSIKTGPSIFSTSSRVTCIALSISITHLLVGTDLGEIHILSLPSHQTTRTLTPHSGPITHLSTLLRPPDLHISPSQADRWPSMEIRPFERMRVGKVARDLQEVSMPLRPSLSASGESGFDLLDSLRPRLKRDTTRMISGDDGVETGGGANGVVGRGKAEERLVEVLEENKRLKASLEKATKLNDRMWKGVVDLHLVKDGMAGTGEAP